MPQRTQSGLNEPNQKNGQLLRIITPIGKYWITKRAIPFLGEAMECLGGNGYIEDSILPRLYREAPVNAIWEGSGNVQCLDLMRVLNKTPELLTLLLEELNLSKGKIDSYDAYLETFLKDVNQYTSSQFYARTFMTKLALLVQGANMIKFSSIENARLFCDSRLTDQSSYQFGMLKDDRLVDGVLGEYIF